MSRETEKAKRLRLVTSLEPPRHRRPLFEVEPWWLRIRIARTTLALLACAALVGVGIVIGAIGRAIVEALIAH